MDRWLVVGWTWGRRHQNTLYIGESYIRSAKQDDNYGASNIKTVFLPNVHRRFWREQKKSGQTASSQKVILCYDKTKNNAQPFYNTNTSFLCVCSLCVPWLYRSTYNTLMDMIEFW